MIPHILSSAECHRLVEEFETSSATQTEQEAFYRGSLGLYQPRASLELVPRLQALLTPHYGELEFENTYMRAYVRGSVLKIHTDRVGLDVTLSVCLEHNFEGAYPLWRSRKPFPGPWREDLPTYEPWITDAEAFELGVGDGVAMEGIRYPHWRDSFEHDARAVYIFFHWRRKRPPITAPPLAPEAE